jgi:hypothetical protein
MPLSIDAWKGGIKDSLPSTHYEVIINPPVGGGTELQLRTESASMPGVSFLSVDNFSPYGNGLMYNIPYRYNPQEVTMIHTIDEKADVYKTFREWGNKVVDLDGNSKFGAKYMEPGGGGYVVDFTLVVYNRMKEIAKQVVFIEAFPINIEPVQMSWGQHDEIAKISVSYRFTRFIVGG